MIYKEKVDLDFSCFSTSVIAHSISLNPCHSNPHSLSLSSSQSLSHQLLRESSLIHLELTIFTSLEALGPAIPKIIEGNLPM
jgi:hypothetical protein